MFKKLIIAVLCCLPMSLMAQTTFKFGTVNSAEIIAAMPERAAAEQQLQDLSKKYEDEFVKVQEEFQNKYKGDGRWFRPRIRAKGYAEERKAKVHQRGEKEGQELTEYEKGLRSGYLLSQADHAGQYKYGQARDAGFSKKEAGELSKKPWKEIKPIIAKKRKDKGGDAA